MLLRQAGETRCSAGKTDYSLHCTHGYSSEWYSSFCCFGRLKICLQDCKLFQVSSIALFLALDDFFLFLLCFQLLLLFPRMISVCCAQADFAEAHLLSTILVPTCTGGSKSLNCGDMEQGTGLRTDISTQATPWKSPLPQLLTSWTSVWRLSAGNKFMCWSTDVIWHVTVSRFFQCCSHKWGRRKKATCPSVLHFKLQQRTRELNQP